jgi:hypothetical protein
MFCEDSPKIDAIFCNIYSRYSKLNDDLLSYQLIYGKIPIKNHVYFMKNEILDFNILVNRFKTLNKA